MRAWPLVHEVVLDPATEPFVKASGDTVYAHYRKNPEMKELMQQAMSRVFMLFMKAILDGYDEFSEVERLVDVGGSTRTASE
ncbi:hypothetical protein ACJRO7_032855 [Eucalyptus globulus]|uniref:O-methyltransferase C-terminal domain-containing protein n=1 Tax=Eucalyptus globulus TaxID=34317 RepID=A0ABD3JS18_EUCGL